jgi:hypothetical protein
MMAAHAGIADKFRAIKASLRCLACATSRARLWLPSVKSSAKRRSFEQEQIGASAKTFFRRTGSTLSTGAVMNCMSTPQKIHGGNFERSPAARATMATLYDLLGALPHDDADALRAAFRRAVKGAHPDLRPGDPDAALKFRQIVRASEILGDPEQRAAYDDLMEVALLEHDGPSAHPIAARIHRLASGVIALSGALVVTVGGYLLFMHMSAASVASANIVGLISRPSLDIAAVSPAGAPSAISVGTSIPDEPAVPGAAMPATKAERVVAADTGRARGIFANRTSDLNDAMSDLGQAFRLDPKFLPAFVDRGMIFYHTQKLNHVFPEVARANRVEKASRSKSAPAITKKPVVDQAAIAASMMPLPRPRMAAHDASRNEGFEAAMLR